MKMTNERKAYGAVLAAAVGLLTWSQVSGETGTTGTGSADPANLITTGPATPVHAPVHVTTVADRLRAYDRKGGLDVESAPDAFCPPSIWVTALTTAKDAAEKSVPVVPVVTFHQKHRLDAVMVSRPECTAIIDGRTVRVGQTVDGFKLVAVTHTSAQLESPTGVRVDLRIVEPLMATAVAGSAEDAR